MRTLLTRLAAAGCAMLALAGPAGAQALITNVNCSAAPNGHVVWPATNPVWEMDVVRPANSSGSDGSGLEVRNVYYRGRLVMKRGHVPILNVEYDSGCTCFRDWSDQEAPYCATGHTGTGASSTCNSPAPSSCVYGTAGGNVYTTCDRNLEGASGGTTGSFNGIAIEDFGTEMVMTAHMTAGWYRYRMKWHFYLDGRIWPEYSFSAASNGCTGNQHRHHAYWRFDFDIDGTPNNDTVTEVNPSASTSTLMTNEAQRMWPSSTSGMFWEVRDATSGAGYDIIPSSADLLLPADQTGPSPAILDVAVVRYSAGTVDDGSPSCAISPTGLGLNNETLANQDIVFWYRSGAIHLAGNQWECDIVGPTLRPEGFDPTAGEEGPEAMLGGLVLESARPNPFNPTTAVRFRVAEPQYVTVRLYDVTGREVATLFEGWARENREETVRVDGTALPGGAYIVRLEGERVQGSTRVVLLK